MREGCCSSASGQCAAFDVFHHDRHARVVLHEVEHLDDVRVVHLHPAPGLAAQLGHRRLIHAHQLRHKLKRHLAPQFLILRQPHDAHAAPAQLADQGETTKHLGARGHRPHCVAKPALVAPVAAGTGAGFVWRRFWPPDLGLSKTKSIIHGLFFIDAGEG